jgi:hypothetical protein
MAGAPSFESLDGAVLGVMAAIREERGKVEVAVEVEETEEVEREGRDAGA